LGTTLVLTLATVVLALLPSLLFFLFEQRRKHPIRTQFSVPSVMLRLLPTPSL
jgi:ABC-type arginine transport system permease subunit